MIALTTMVYEANQANYRQAIKPICEKQTQVTSTREKVSNQTRTLTVEVEPISVAQTRHDHFKTTTTVESSYSLLSVKVQRLVTVQSPKIPSLFTRFFFIEVIHTT
uniref:Uncharacterized protein n=1 Tax=Photinus pyralis TaxID=7054 RepID=A0A1Y1K6M9_PHOPY